MAVVTKSSRSRLVVKDTGWNKILRNAQGSASIEVGLIGPKASARHVKSKKSVAEIGAIHEFGAEGANIPERSFLRATITAHQVRYLGLMKAAASAVLGGTPPELAYAHMASVIVNDVKQAIRSGIDPELAESTLATKDNPTPLIDTTQLIEAIEHRVLRYFKRGGK